MRESLFNVLEGGRFGDRVAGAQVLDLYAGTGALGLEALSRGAAHATFVETGRAALGVLARNIARTGEEAASSVLKRDARRLPPNPGPPATLVFADPPYGKGLGAAALTRALEAGWIADDALLVLEDRADAPANPVAGLSLLDSRTWGDTRVDFLGRSGPAT